MIDRKKLLGKFKELRLTTKEEVLDFIDKMLRIINSYSERDKKRSSSYYHTVNEIMNEFRDLVDSAKLVENIDDFWCYDIDFDQVRIALILEYYNVKGEDGDRLIEEREASYTLISISSELLNVEQFAALHDVEEGTVRQWIRRGKIRTAIKEGKEWRIPELTEKPDRGYSDASYAWYKELTDLPDGFDFLNDYCFAQLKQNSEDKKEYIVDLYGEENAEKEEFDKHHCIKLTKREVENLELFLISNKDVYYKDSLIAIWPEAITSELSLNKGEYGLK